MKSTLIKLAAAQVAPVFLDREATTQKACEYIIEAGKNGAQIIGFPESFIAGYPHWYKYYKITDQASAQFYQKFFLSSVVVPSPVTDQLCSAAKEAGIYVVIGINERFEYATGTVYNSQLYISAEGKILGVHRKIVPTREERLVYGSGDGSTLSVFDTEYGKLGGLICGEHSNSLARFALLALGENIHVASWPAFTDGGNKHDAIDFRSRNHAHEGKVFVINATGIFSIEMAEAIQVHLEKTQQEQTDGSHSSIVGPNGEFIVAPSGGEKIIYGEVDLSSVIGSKMTHDVVGHYNRFDIFQLTVNRKKLVPLRLVDEEVKNLD